MYCCQMNLLELPLLNHSLPQDPVTASPTAHLMEVKLPSMALKSLPVWGPVCLFRLNPKPRPLFILSSWQTQPSSQLPSLPSCLCFQVPPILEPQMLSVCVEGLCLRHPTVGGGERRQQLYLVQTSFP